MTDEILADAAAELTAELGISVSGIISEKQLLQLLAAKVAAVIDQGPDVFYSLMYRLDIAERRLQEITGGDDVALKVAQLIYARQLAKSRSRLHYRQQPGNIDPDLKW